VDELLGFAQLGLGRVIAGLLEGILDGPENLSVRNKVRAALKRLKGPKGFRFGPISLPTSTGNTYGLHKGKPILKGVGLGRLTKRVRLKPSHWIKAFTSEDRSGVFTLLLSLLCRSGDWVRLLLCLRRQWMRVAWEHRSMVDCLRGLC
jgi:hypothetical protein